MNKPATCQMMEDRIAQLGSWLDDESPFARFDQRHLDPGTPEQAYWHLGYMTALQDALALMRSNEDAPAGTMQELSHDAAAQPGDGAADRRDE